MHFSLGPLTLHGADSAGVQWRTDPRRCKGWWGGPASTITIVQNARRHGGTAGDAYLAADHLRLGGTILAPTEAARDAAADVLRAAASLDQTALTAHGAGGDRWAKVRREGPVEFEPTSDISADWSVGLVMLDPRRFGEELTTEVRLPSTSGGLRWPVRWPLRWPAKTERGQESLTNVGQVAGPVWLRLEGPSDPSDPPLQAPVVTHVSTGRRLVFAASVELGPGEWVDVDAEAQTILAQGMASRARWVTEDGFPTFEPGPNLFAFSAAVYSASSRLTVRTWPAW